MLGERAFEWLGTSRLQVPVSVFTGASTYLVVEGAGQLTAVGQHDEGDAVEDAHGGHQREACDDGTLAHAPGH